MPEEFKPGCKRPVIKKTVQEVQESANVIVKEESSMVKVGKPAPMFSAAGYLDGKFLNFDLEEFKGKWILLCFYPGDFTFV